MDKGIKTIWIEATGCSGNIISFLNGENPDLIYTLTNMIDLKYSNTLMVKEGERAYSEFLKTIEEDFILIVDGAVSTIENGMYNIIANYKGRRISALEAVTLAGKRAKYVLAVGTCASFGGVSKSFPNPSLSKSVNEILKRRVINLPGCPCHPDWVIGVISYLILYGDIETDELGRPVFIYGNTIHDNCTRRGYFHEKIFAEKLGDKGCMFKLGCRGPITNTN